MKDAMMVVATLLALSLGAQGQTQKRGEEAGMDQTGAAEAAAKAWLAENRSTVEVVAGWKTAKLEGDIDSPEAKAVVQSVLALPNDKIGGYGINMLSAVVRASADPDAAAAVAARLEAIAEDPSAGTVARKMADSALAQKLAGKEGLKRHLDRLGATDIGAQAVSAAARRLGDPAIAEEWFAANRAKGLTAPPYRKWFNAHVKALSAPEQAFAIQQEIGGLLRGTEDLERAKPWIEELRYKLYVSKEAAAP